MRIHNLFFIIASAVLLLSITSCHSSRQSVSGSGTLTAGGSPRHRLASLADFYAGHPIEAYSVPATITLTAPAKAKISGTISVVPSRYIHFSARFLGMEVGSLLITPDSIFGRIKPGKKYIAESLDAVKAVLPVSLYQIQELIAGRVIFPGYDSIDRKALASCSYSSGTDFWTVTPDHSGRVPEITFSLSMADDRLSQVSAVAPHRAAVLITVMDYASTRSGDMPQELNVNIVSGDRSLAADIEMNTSRIKYDIDSSKTWSVPKGYTKVSPTDIVKILANM